MPSRWAGCVRLAFGAAAAGACACSLITSYDGFEGDGGSARDAASCTCVVPPPSGWTGPAALYEDALSKGMPPSCPPGSDYATPGATGYEGLDAPPAKCGCTCDPPTGEQCAAATAWLYDDPGCLQPCGANPVTPPQPICTVFPPSVSTCAKYVRVDAIAAVGGTCTPVQSKTIPPPTWSTAATVCSGAGAAGGTCAAGQICAPAPPAPFRPNACIFQHGDVPCPSGSYTERHVLYATVADTRACPTCTCGAPSGPCTGGVTAFTASATADAGPCYNAVPEFPLGTMCGALNGATAGVQSSLIVAAGTCAPSASQPSGTAVAQEPTTACCAVP